MPSTYLFFNTYTFCIGDYRETVSGVNIPFREFGFSGLEEFLNCDDAKVSQQLSNSSILMTCRNIRIMIGDPGLFLVYFVAEKYRPPTHTVICKGAIVYLRIRRLG